MSIALSSTGLAPVAPPFPVRRFSLDEYHRMIEKGILSEDEPVELLEGWIAPKMPRNPLHDAVIDQSQETLRRHLPSAWRLRVQSAVTIGASEPEPDLAIVQGPASRYVDHHPGPQEIALLVEVADTSLDHDRNVKAPIYARAGIAHYWIINLVDRRLEVHHQPDPSSAAYRRRELFAPPSTVELIIDRSVVAAIPVAELLPPGS